MSTTLQQLMDASYGIIGTQNSSPTSTYDRTTMIRLINDVQRDICTGGLALYRDNALPETVRKQILPAVMRQATFQTKKDISVHTTPAIGDTQIVFSDTSHLPSSGQIYIKGNVFTYSGNTGTTLTGIPATGDYSVQYPYDTGTRAIFCFDIPGDFNTIARLIIEDANNIDPVDWRDLALMPSDEQTAQYRNRMGVSLSPFTPSFSKNSIRYSVYKGRFIVIFGVPELKQVILQYEPDPIDMVLPTDVSVIEDQKALNIIPIFASTRFMMLRNEEQRAKIINNNEGMRVIQAYYEWCNIRANEGVHNRQIQYGHKAGIMI